MKVCPRIDSVLLQFLEGIYLVCIGIYRYTSAIQESENRKMKIKIKMFGSGIMD
jgi:hypothetical protein